MTKLSKKNKIIISILIILMALVVMSVIFMFVAECVAGDIVDVTLALELAGIEPKQAYDLIDAVEEQYENVTYFVDNYNRDTLLATADDHTRLNALIPIAISHVSSEQLAGFLYELGNDKKRVGLNGFFSLCHFADTGRISKVRDYRIVKYIVEKMQGTEVTLEHYDITRSEWQNCTDNAYRVLANIYNTPAEDRVTFVTNLRTIMASENIMGEIPIKDIYQVVHTAGVMMHGLVTPSGVAKVISETIYKGENEYLSALVGCPTMLEDAVRIMESIELSELMYDIFGDYPHMERVMNNVFYIAKGKVDTSHYETIARECTTFAHATFDKEQYMSERLFMDMIEKSRNIDEIDFTAEELAFWQSQAEHFFPPKEESTPQGTAM